MERLSSVTNIQKKKTLDVVKELITLLSTPRYAMEPRRCCWFVTSEEEVEFCDWVPQSRYSVGRGQKEGIGHYRKVEFVTPDCHQSISAQVINFRTSNLEYGANSDTKSISRRYKEISRFRPKKIANYSISLVRITYTAARVV